MSLKLVVHIHDLPAWSVPLAQVERLRRALPDAEVVDVRDHAAAESAVPGAEVMFATLISLETLAAADRLRWVHSSAVGVGGLHVAELAARGIAVSNSRGIHAATIAEHALALILALRRQLPFAMRRQEATVWSQIELMAPVVPLAAATRVLVVGLGEIGSRVARYAAALGMQVKGVRHHVDRPLPEGVLRVHPVADLPVLLPQTDILVLAAPQTGKKGSLIGSPELRLMKPSALLVNVARGGLVDEAALVEALEQGRLGGAGLDVFTREPLDPESRLWKLPSVLITPHSASFDGDYWTPVVDAFLSNLDRFRRGEPLGNLVDPRLGY